MAISHLPTCSLSHLPASPPANQRTRGLSGPRSSLSLASTWPFRTKCLMLRWVGLILGIAGNALASVPFVLQGPGIDPSHFQVTAFATGLNYPVGMATMSDGSLLVTSTDGPNYFNSQARLIRLVDSNHDGKADGPPTVLL